MTKVAKWSLAAIVLFAGVAAAQAELTAQNKAQNKLLAYRAARVDAMRKLAERINGLQISSETTVRDFVTESDDIRTAMRSFLLGAREADKPSWMEDGTCEVRMEVTLQETIASLKQICNRSYKGNKFKAEDFEQLNVTVKDKIISETGMGAPRPEEAFTDGELIPTPAGGGSPSFPTGAAKKFWMDNCPGQARLMAVRAARVEGMRKLAERIKGVVIDSQTTVKDFVTESDDINVSMQTFLVGAREKGIRYYDNELIVEVEMEVTLRTVYASLKSWGEAHYKGDKAKIKEIEELTVSSKDTIIKEIGMGVPPAKYLEKASVEIRAGVSLAAQAPGWVSETIRTTGMGAMDKENDNAAQAKLMARRAAELDGRRKLAEQINGLMITSNTSVRDFVTESDDIATSMLTFQQGAYVVEKSEKYMEDGTVEVTVALELKPLWNMIVHYRKELSIDIK